jgi:anthranilate phosphoribosyltransferase
VAGRVGDLREGVELASQAVASGGALAALHTLRRASLAHAS